MDKSEEYTDAYLTEDAIVEDSEKGMETVYDPEAKELDINPFNPEDISIITNSMSMDFVIRRLIQGSIILNPDFQRKEVWSWEKRSQLIESIMLKIPLPMFYMQSDEDGVYTVVDGLQRLSTIRDYVLGADYMNSKKEDGSRREELRGLGFKLKGLEFWSEYEGKQFCQLPPKLQNRILEAQFQVTVIQPTTPEVVRRNIFKRINTGGVQLNSQEIRNAIYTGKATELLNEMAKMECFVKLVGNSVNKQRMQDKELILRFLSFMVRNYTDYNRTVTADMWLGDTMIIINSMDDLNNLDYRRLSNWKTKEPLKIKTLQKDYILSYFERSMTRCSEMFGEHAFRKSFEGEKKSPINRCLFETWAVVMGRYSVPEYKRLYSNRREFLEDYRKIIKTDTDFDLSISKYSMRHSLLKKRFQMLIDLTDKYAL